MTKHRHMNERQIWEKYGKPQKSGTVRLGPHSSYQLRNTPRRILYSLSRYKFAAKMIGDGKSILELGCSDGLGTLILAEFAERVTAVDFDRETVSWARKLCGGRKTTFLCRDFLNRSFGAYDAVVSLDVIEHVRRENERHFFNTIRMNLLPTGFCVIGTPNITSRKYSSKIVNDAHINLYSSQRLVRAMKRHFHNVFLFGANDEVVHTGFKPMAQYLIAVGCRKKDSPIA